MNAVARRGCCRASTVIRNVADALMHRKLIKRRAHKNYNSSIRGRRLPLLVFACSVFPLDHKMFL